MASASPEIGTLNEKPLHAALKRWYARPGDEMEVTVDGYVVDLVRGDLLVEIQTGGFSGIKRKLTELTERHRVRLVHPIARERWVVRRAGGERLGRRKSPRRGGLAQLFAPLSSFPGLVAEPRFSLEVLLIQEEVVRRYPSTGPRRWRGRGWVASERRLLRVLDRRVFEGPEDFAALLPRELAEPFTTAELAAAAGLPRRLAQWMAYCLREMGATTAVGKRGNAILYERAPTRPRRGVVILGAEPLRP